MAQRPMGMADRGKKAHRPDDVALTADIGGRCNSRSCVGNYRNAKLTAFWDGHLEITCQKCHARTEVLPSTELTPESPFWPDDPAYRHAFKPFGNDEDTEHPRRDYYDFNRKRG